MALLAVVIACQTIAMLMMSQAHSRQAIEEEEKALPKKEEKKPQEAVVSKVLLPKKKKKQPRGPGLDNLWIPPAHPVVGPAPERPKLPTNLGDGHGLSESRREFAKIDDERAKSRQHKSALENQRVKVAHLNGDESIFVSIASFRDPECAKTIARLFDRAAVPNRVHVGICQQNDAIDVDCVAGLADLIECQGSNVHAACGRVRSGQIRAYRLSSNETLGPTIGRHLSERLYREETYVLSIDAHSNFAMGWDALLIDSFKKIKNPKAIITSYPASYSQTNHSEKWADLDRTQKPCEICRKIDDQARVVVNPYPYEMMSICRTRRVPVGRTLSFKHDVNSMRRPPEATLVGFLAAGFNFARGSRIKDVPYDEHSIFLFDGEETSLAVRAWTHGYDFYHPDRDIVSHLYIPNKSPLRPVFWATDWQRRSRIQFWTMLRMNYILGLHNLLDYWVDPKHIDLRDLHKYGLGTERRAVDYWPFVSVDPHRDGPEWSDNLCAVFETTGLQPFPKNTKTSSKINDYANYDKSFPHPESA